MDLEVSNDAEQNENIKLKKIFLTSASIYDSMLDAVMDSLLITIAKEIRDAIDGHPLEEECSGTEHICQTLQYVNDVIRLHEILIPTENSSTASRRPFTKLPRIVAPYIAHGDENEMHGSLGNLVIVDTPGPNENTTTNFLKEIMIRELRKATVILVILDYTVLNTEADNLVEMKF